MKYFYSSVRLPAGVPGREINAAAQRLHEKLAGLDLDQADISEYNKKYLGKKIANPVGALQLYTHILSLSLAGFGGNLKDFTFIDYGGGSGALSFLAKELGIGRVIYNDIYEVSCEDVKKISAMLDLQIDGLVVGDIDELVEYVAGSKIPLNAIASYDVIEHIYDIENYLRRLRSLSSAPFRIVFGSGANIKNPFIVRRIKDIHSNCEHQDRKREWGGKERDSLQGYLSLRRDIIKNYAQSLDDRDVQKLAEMTRGLMKHDIEKCVDEYLATGKISYRPDHPSNTCDPHTGNWAEHLMDATWMEKILIEEGFRARILSGYYPDTGGTYKRMLKQNLNYGIGFLGKASLFFAPYYIVYADYEGG